MTHDWRWDLYDDEPVGTWSGGKSHTFMDEESLDQWESDEREKRGTVGFHAEPRPKAGRHRRTD